ncbi:MAG: hypothetical protein Ta2B_03770 [Termitinemataceae bacterium]|nr:MAG: hypothetical protein Ta2B_03770 [Termitinemataceae bacterium]
MVIFSVLIVPLFYFLWRSIRPAEMACGGMWALPAGCIAAVVRFFVPAFIDAEGFGVSRWISAFVDYTALPVIYPLVLSLLARKLKPTSYINDNTGFIFCALIPVALVRSIFWSTQVDILRLVITPVLWVSAALTFYPLLNFFNKAISGKKIVAVFGIITTLFITTTAWLEFFAQQFVLAAILLFVPIALMLIVLVILINKHAAAARVNNA